MTAAADRHDHPGFTLFPLVLVEAVLAWCAAGWVFVGLYTGFAHAKSPAGNAFVAAATFVGSWKVLTGLLAVTAVFAVAGIVTRRSALRRVGLGLGAFNWAFIAAGLSTSGFVSTAIVVYPALSALAVAAYLTTPPGPGRER